MRSRSPGGIAISFPMERTQGAKKETGMKKNNIGAGKPKIPRTNRKTGSVDSITIGMDLGDKTSRYCVMNGAGEVMKQGSVATTKRGMGQTFATMRHSRIAIEVGTHSPWLSRLLKSYGHEVIVANPRQVKLISQSSRKDDKLDAQLLARLARVDPQLLRPIRHRSEQAQADLLLIRGRAALVDARSGLVNTARGFTKAAGERLPSCDTDQMGMEKLEGLPAAIRETLKPLLSEV